MFIDFAEVKTRFSFADTVAILGVALKHSGNQWRGPCPICRTGGERALVVTDGKGFYCFAARKGGDQIALVAHIKDMPLKEAAHWMMGTVPVNSTVPGTVPESERGQEGARTLAPLSYLEADHPAVDAVGFSTEVAKRLGIGYAGKGIMRGTVAVPVRDERGVLQGYIGVTEAKLPPDFTPNVVAFKKSA